jgi:carboxypeptidase PM20D1
MRVLLTTLLLTAFSNQSHAQTAVDRAARNLSQAITFKTISHQKPADDDPAAFAGLRNWLVTAYPRVNATMAHELIPGGALLYKWQGSDPSLLPVLFLAHQDVVPVEPGTESQWTQSAFAGTIAGGYVWGRGALDDKGMLVTLMETAEGLITAGFTPKRTIYFGFGSDEEVGGIRGARHIADVLVQRSIRLAWVLDEGSSIVNNQSDPSATQKLVAKIGIGQKGYATVVLTAKGQGGSSAMPPAKTAVDMLSRALITLAEQPFASTQTEPNRTTIVPTMLQSGVKDNVLPTIATATLNARLWPGDTVDKLIAHIRNKVSDCDIGISLSIGVNPPPLSTTANPGFIALQNTVNKLTATIPVTTGVVSSTTDARHMMQLTDAVYYFMPWILHEDDLARIHGINERLSLTQLAFGIRFFTELISKQ